MLNARIRKRWLKGDCLTGVVGPRADLTYKYNYLGAGPHSLAQFADHPPANKQKPMFILGAGAFARPDGEAVLALAAKAAMSLGVVKDGWNGFNVLHTAASRVGGLDLGLVPGEGGLDAIELAKAGAADVVFNLGADEIEIEPGAFVVYIGSHGDTGAHRADVILPGAAYTEKTRHLRQHRRPPAIRRARHLPAGPGARGLGDSARAFGYVGRQAALRLRRRAARCARDRPSASDRLRPDCACGRFRAVEHYGGRRSRRCAVRLLGFGILLHQPDRARLARDGGMRGAGQGPPRRGRRIGPIMSSATPTRPSAPDHSIAIAIGIAVVAVLVVVIGLIVLFISSGGASALGHWLTGTAFGTFVRYVLESLAMLVGVLLSTAVMIYAERKIWASVQLRRGPNVVGPWGTFQPFADFGKFILKEPIIPASANKGVFVLAPLVGVVLAFAAWAVIPVNDGWVVGNINVGILYLFAVSSLGVYGIIMAGWASNSKYPFMAALRSAAQMVSYEVSIGFVLVTVLLCANSLNLTDIVRAQDTKFGFLGWYWLRLLPMFVIFFISSLAETNRPPFDLVEAELELVAGHMVEYSASMFLLQFLTELVAILGMSSLAAVLFMGGWLSPLPFPPFTWVPGIIWFLIKAWSVVFMFSMVKAFVPRYRYDQLMRLGWKVFLPISLFMVVLVAAVVELFGSAS